MGEQKILSARQNPQVFPFPELDCIESLRFCAQRRSDVGRGTAQDGWGVGREGYLSFDFQIVYLYVTKNGVIYIYFQRAALTNLPGEEL